MKHTFPILLIASLFLVASASGSVIYLSTWQPYEKLWISYNGTPFIDAYGGHTLSNSGVALDTTSPVFGAGDGYYGTNGANYINVTSGQSDFAYGTGSYTIRFWFYTTSSATSQVLWDQRPLGTSGNYSDIQINSNGNMEFDVGSTDITGSYVISPDTWYQYVVERNVSTSTTTQYLNGISNGSVTDTTNYLNGANRPVIGGWGYTLGALTLRGYMDEVTVWNVAIPINNLFPQITETNTPEPLPNASFTVTPNAGTPGVLVAFTDTSSTPSLLPIISENWSFGDDAGTDPYSNTIGSQTHVYAYAGIFIPTLTVTTSAGSTTFTGQPITVSISQSTANTNVVYSAQLYRFILQNLEGGALSNISVVMTPINYTMQANWTNLLFGVSTQVNLQTGQLSGTTGSDGSLGVPMITSLEYQVNISGLAGDGETVPLFSIKEYPPSVGTDIIVSVPTIQHPAISLTQAPTTISYDLYNQTIRSNQTVLSTNYLDSTGGTNLAIVYVVNQSGYVLNTTTYTGSAANNIVNNFTYTFTSGDIVSYGFSAYSTTEGAWNNITQPLTFNTGTSLFGGSIPTQYDGWLAIILIVFVSAAFTASSVYIGVIGVGLMGEFFYHITQWFTPAIGGGAFDAMCVFWIAIGIIGFITKKSRTVF